MGSVKNYSLLSAVAVSTTEWYLNGLHPKDIAGINAAMKSRDNFMFAVSLMKMKKKVIWYNAPN